MQLEQPLSRPLFSFRALVQLIVPMMVEQALAMMIGLADVVMISGVGEAAVSGVSLVDSINNLMIQVLAALSSGGAVVVAQYLGRQNTDDARAAANQLLVVVTLSSVALTALAMLTNGGLLRLLFGNIEPNVMHSARLYFYLSAASYPALAVYNSIAGIFRAMGNSKVAMMTALFMNVVHIGCNSIMIYVFHWGVAGAGIASLLSRTLSAYVMCRLIDSRHYPVWIEISKNWRYMPDMVRRILNIGIPSGLENGMFHIGRLLTLGIVAGFGTAAIAGNAIASSICNMVMVPGTAIGLAMITVVGQCMGAGEHGQAGKNVVRMMLMTYAAKIVLGAGLLLFAGKLVGLFGLEPAAAELAKNLLYSIAVAQVLFWPTSFPLGHALRATGDVRFTMIVSVVSMWAFRVVLSYVLAVHMGLGTIGVWYAMYIDWIARTAAFVIRWRSGRWRSIRVI